MADFERFQEYGRIRRIAKKVDPYSLTIERDNKIYVVLSSKQIISADKFHGMRDAAVFGWLNMLFTIKMDKRQACLYQ